MKKRATFSSARHRWAVGAVIVTSGLLMCAPEAHASHWQITYKSQGQMSYGSTLNGKQTDGPWISTWTGGRTGNNTRYGGLLTPAGTVIQGTNQGTITVVFDWVKDMYEPTLQPVPSTVTFKVTASATATGYAYDPVTLVAADTGFSGQKFGGAGISGPSGNPPYWSGNKTANATQLLSASSNGQAHVEYVLPQITAMGTITAATARPNQSGSGEAAVNESAQLDNRSVSLSRSSKDTSKLSNGSWVIYGDTTYSYSYVPTDEAAIGSHIVNTQSITASPSPTQGAGAWTPHTNTNVVGVLYRVVVN